MNEKRSMTEKILGIACALLVLVSSVLGGALYSLKLSGKTEASDRWETDPGFRRRVAEIAADVVRATLADPGFASLIDSRVRSIDQSDGVVSAAELNAVRDALASVPGQIEALRTENRESARELARLSALVETALQRRTDDGRSP